MDTNRAGAWIGRARLSERAAARSENEPYRDRNTSANFALIRSIRANHQLPRTRLGRTVSVMEVMTEINCPWCGQPFELAIDTSAGSQRFTTDCEVCCRPMEVVAECEPGEILSLDVLTE